MTISRRTAISLLSAGAASAAIGRPGSTFAASASHGSEPILATPQQVEAEKTLLKLLKEPRLKQVQAAIRSKWAATPRGQSRDGAARLDEAIAQWTNSLIFGELSQYQATPAFLWGTDDTPRTWLGHTIGGVGTSGDNPDSVYRTSVIDGDSQYEIIGRFDPQRRPTQLTMEIDTTLMTKMPKIDYSK